MTVSKYDRDPGVPALRIRSFRSVRLQAKRGVYTEGTGDMQDFFENTTAATPRAATHLSPALTSVRAAAGLLPEVPQPRGDGGGS